MVEVEKTERERGGDGGGEGKEVELRCLGGLGRQAMVGQRVAGVGCHDGGGVGHRGGEIRRD